MCKYDSIAIYILRDNVLYPEFVNGHDSEVFGPLEIPIGEGLSGWVAQCKRPIVNGNPSVETGYLNDPTKFSVSKSALSVPLEGSNGVVGVLSLYADQRDAFPGALASRRPHPSMLVRGPIKSLSSFLAEPPRRGPNSAVTPISTNSKIS